MAVSSDVLESFGRYAARCEAANLHDATRYQRRIRRWELVGRAASPLLYLARQLNRGVPVNHSVTRTQLPFSTSGALKPENAPSPHRLSRDKAPVLFSMIDDLSRCGYAPEISRVYLVHASGAWITAGLSAPKTHPVSAAANKDDETCLYLGRDLIASLSPSELRAVIAHELGHIAYGHRAIAMRLEVNFRAWSQLGDIASLKTCGQRGRGIAQYLRLPGAALFARWYARKLLAHACPVYRNAELEADRFAAALTSRDALCRALIRIAIRHARDAGDAGDAERDQCDADILKACLNERARLDARHPALRERLAALGWNGSLPPALTDTAAELFQSEAANSGN